MAGGSPIDWVRQKASPPILFPTGRKAEEKEIFRELMRDIEGEEREIDAVKVVVPPANYLNIAFSKLRLSIKIKFFIKLF